MQWSIRQCSEHFISSRAVCFVVYFSSTIKHVTTDNQLFIKSVRTRNENIITRECLYYNKKVKKEETNIRDSPKITLLEANKSRIIIPWNVYYIHYTVYYHNNELTSCVYYSTLALCRFRWSSSLVFLEDISLWCPQWNIYTPRLLTAPVFSLWW